MNNQTGLVEAARLPRGTTLNSTPQNDGTIVAAVLAGETERFDELVARYRTPLLRLAFSRLGCSSAADDVVQETLLCAFKSLPSYDSRFSFRTWLWTILLNQCRRHYRQRMRRQDRTTSWETAADPEPEGLISRDAGPPAALAAKEQKELLQATMNQLPEVQADALRLRFFGGLKFHEIAEAMGCSLSTAKNRVRWGLTKMTELLASPTNVNGTYRLSKGEREAGERR